MSDFSSWRGQSAIAKRRNDCYNYVRVRHQTKGKSISPLFYNLVHEDVKISQIPFFPLKLCPRFHKNSTQNFFFATHLNALLIVVGHHSNALMSDADVGCDAIFVHTISSLYNLEKTTIMPIMTTLFDPPDKIYVSQTNWTPGQFFVPFFIISTTSNWLLWPNFPG